MVSSLFGGFSLDSTIKKLYNVLGRLTYDSAGRLRVYADAAVSINANQTIGTANISVGDTGKQNTVINNSVSNIQAVRRNWK